MEPLVMDHGEQLPQRTEAGAPRPPTQAQAPTSPFLEEPGKGLARLLVGLHVGIAPGDRQLQGQERDRDGADPKRVPVLLTLTRGAGLGDCTSARTAGPSRYCPGQRSSSTAPGDPQTRDAHPQPQVSGDSGACPPLAQLGRETRTVSETH